MGFGLPFPYLSRLISIFFLLEVKSTSSIPSLNKVSFIHSTIHVLGSRLFISPPFNLTLCPIRIHHRADVVGSRSFQERLILNLRVNTYGLENMYLDGIFSLSVTRYNKASFREKS